MRTATTSPTTSPKPRWFHSQAFKAEVLGFAKQPNVGFVKATLSLVIYDSLLCSWEKAAKNEGKEDFRGHGVLTEVDAELTKFRRESYRLLSPSELPATSSWKPPSDERAIRPDPFPPIRPASAGTSCLSVNLSHFANASEGPIQQQYDDGTTRGFHQPLIGSRQARPYPAKGPERQWAA